MMHGKVILITGAAGGLGAALCKSFAAKGASIVAMDINLEALQYLHASLSTPTLIIGGRAGDICQPENAYAAIASTRDRFGRLDILINNAGIAIRELFLVDDASLYDTQSSAVFQHIQKQMSINFFGAVAMSHAALPLIRESRGVIAAISSVAGYAPLYGRCGYVASKHALQGFMNTLRCEEARYGVAVCVVCPSFIATNIAYSSDNSPDAQRLTAGGEAMPEVIAAQIVQAIGARQSLLLPDRTTTIAWWMNKFFPSLYAKIMIRKTRSEFHSSAT